jgi:hypothetical protein
MRCSRCLTDWFVSSRRLAREASPDRFQARARAEEYGASTDGNHVAQWTEGWPKEVGGRREGRITQGWR